MGGLVPMAAWGSRKIIVGATKSFGWTADQALEMCDPGESRTAMDGSGCTSFKSLEGAVEELRLPAEKVWSPLSGWGVHEVR